MWMAGVICASRFCPAMTDLYDSDHAAHPSI
jgi:hypothetical protein